MAINTSLTALDEKYFDFAHARHLLNRAGFGGTPAQIDALVRDEVVRLGSREGGLMMIYGLYPGVPLENAGALMDAMEKYATYYN